MVQNHVLIFFSLSNTPFFFQYNYSCKFVSSISGLGILPELCNLCNLKTFLILLILNTPHAKILLCYKLSSFYTKKLLTISIVSNFPHTYQNPMVPNSPHCKFSSYQMQAWPNVPHTKFSSHTEICSNKILLYPNSQYQNFLIPNFPHIKYFSY